MIFTYGYLFYIPINVIYAAAILFSGKKGRQMAVRLEGPSEKGDSHRGSGTCMYQLVSLSIPQMPSNDEQSGLSLLPLYFSL